MRMAWLLTVVAMMAGGCAGTGDAGLRGQCISVLKGAFEVEGEEHFWAKMHAAEALTVAGETQWVKAKLREMMKQSYNAQHVCGLCREMIRAGADEYEQPMVTALQRPEYGAQTHAAESLFKVGKVGRRNLMEKAAEGKDPVLGMMACAALVRAGDKGRLERVRKHLADEDERARVVACWVLGQLGDSSDVGRIEKASAGWQGDAKFNAEVALGRLGRAGAVDRLFELLGDEDEKRVAGVCEALAAIKDKRGRPYLVKLLKSDGLDTRVRASHALLGILEP